MKIVAKKISCFLIYEHRQLFSNEVEYNSLYLSNLMGYNVDLLDIEDYKKLDIKTRHQILINHNIKSTYIHFISGSGIIVLIYTDNISVNYTWDEFFYYFVRYKPNSYIITIIKEHS